jgi:hypothetical protein
LQYNNYASVAAGKQTYAQTDTITLDRAIEAAMQNNRM